MPSQPVHNQPTDPASRGAVPGVVEPPPAVMTASARRHYGGPEVLAIEEVPVPTATGSQVLVKVAASSLNALDWHMLTGTPYFLRLVKGLRRPRGSILGADVAGTVVSVGPDVTRLSGGDAVFGVCEGGGCAPFVVVAESNLARIPDGVSFEAAAATPVAGLTAFQGLVTHAAVQPDERVLINGAAGGVGTFAVQIAKARGAEVTAVCSTRNVDMVRRLGADEVIDYTVDDFTESGSRFDVMFDGVGNRTADECLSVLRPGARYVIISGPKDNRWIGPVPKILRTALRFRRAEPSFHQFTASPNVDDLDELGRLLATGSVVPEIQQIIGLEGVAEAMAEIGTGHTRAKIVVKPA